MQTLRAYLDNLIQRLQQWWSSRQGSESEDLLNKPTSFTDGDLRADCEKILLMLEPLLENEYDPKKAFDVTIKVTKTDFYQLTYQLRGINNDLSRERSLSANDCGGEVVEIGFDSLFISNTNHYIPWSQVHSFFQEAMKVCTLTKGHEESTYGPKEHNLRMLSPVFLNIKNVSTSLISILS